MDEMQQTVKAIQAIAAAADPERVTRPCVGCFVVFQDPANCARCYANLYPRPNPLPNPPPFTAFTGEGT